MLSQSIAAIAVAAALSASAAAAQQTSSARPDEPITLTGCVSSTRAGSGEFTFTDPASGGKYRLTGKSVRKFAGQMVEIVGGGRGKRLSVRGGLWPSPNIAGQVGAIDPATASIARQPGGAASGAAEPTLPEFNVVRVRGVDGSCR